ncbi:MAG: pyridoxal phosphate-dependent aminotransferase family protein [Proteobacteria bacterium]|nr:pyridoxal phosphate-dependent aminotransferase family protein [Pseudomonadota bacterium]
MADLFQRCRDYTTADDAKAMGFYPYFLTISEHSDGTEVVIDGKSRLMLGSNNYLGLTFHPKVKEAARAALDTFGTSCSGSRFLNGTLSLHEELEGRLAAFLGTEDAAVISTGYQTNLATLGALFQRDDVAVLDQQDHASIYEGVMIARCRIKRYDHVDMASCEAVLENLKPDKGAAIITDGVFSMEGDLAPIPELVALKKKYGVKLIVDDAHGLGTMGPTGRGSAEHFGLQDEVDVITGTFSKAFASLGGVVAGPRSVINYIKHHGRSLIYSASMAPASVGSALAALDIMENDSEPRERLHANVSRMRRGLIELGYKVGEAPTPVLPIYIGDEMRMLPFWRMLFDEGVYTNAVIPPAVAPDATLVRTSFMASHTPDQIDRALAVFEKVGKLANLI